MKFHEKTVPLRSVASCAQASRAPSAVRCPPAQTQPRRHATLGGSSARRSGTSSGRRQRRPAALCLPQGADEAVDRALRVQGHDVPYVEEAGHFIRHTASCSKVDVLPLLCASPPAPGSRRGRARLLHREPLQRAQPERPGCRLSPASRRGSWQERSRSREHPAMSAARDPQRLPPQQVSCSFQKFSLLHLCSSSPLPQPPPFSAPPHCSQHHREGAGGCKASRCPRGNFWTRWWCPLGEGEERSSGRREWEANQRAAAWGGAGQGRCNSGEARPPGKPLVGQRANGPRGGARGVAGAQGRGGRFV